MSSTDNPTVKTQMLIRKPDAEVFEALVNPEITSKFWFTKSSGRLETGKTVVWEWGQFGVQADITVLEMQQDRLIRFKWPADEKENDHRTVTISFEPVPEQAVFVSVVEEGFDADDPKLIDSIAGQTQGWALVLSALKAWLEHEIILTVVSDHAPPTS